MKLTKKLLTTTLALSLGLVTGAQANLLSNPSFEAYDTSAYPYYTRSFTSTPGWAQFGDGVDLLYIPPSYVAPSPLGPYSVLVGASDGVQYLDMNQAGVLGGIEQIVSATAGTIYKLDLDSVAWAVNAIGGTLGYALFDPFSSTILASGSFTDNVGGTWMTQSLQTTAVSSQIGVRIQGLVATQAGMGLDNVVLTAAPGGGGTVPEPATLALMGLGLAGLGWTRRRKA